MGGEPAAGMGGEAPLGGTLGIRKIAVYQGVEVVLMQGGNREKPNAPIIAERELLVRAWIEPGEDWEARTVAAELTLERPSATRNVNVTQQIDARSEDGELDSTLNFTIRATDVTEETAIAITVREATAPNAELIRWPERSEEPLNASSSQGPLEIVLVPLVVGGFTPDLGTQNLTRFSRYMNRIYPASAVAMSVREPYTLSYDVDSEGYGWDEALDELYALRDADDPAANVYYYGVLTPGATFDDYCPVDCVVGLSTVAGRNDEFSRGSIGTGYFESAADTFSQETLGHELGHAMGREHAPCGDPDYPDPNYPYAGGKLGVYGYNGRALVDPFESLDMMSYCVPVWISDYSWKGIFTRINYVNGLAARQVPAPRATRPRQRTLIVGHDGNLRWGREQAPGTPPNGEPVLVELLDASGAVLEVVAAPFAPFDHLRGGFLSVPSSALARTQADSVRVDGQIVPIR
jgi:hypothetical protein